METNRLEAFSDGVIAVIITVLMLEMKVPHGPDLASLAPVVPVFLSYVLSFVYIGIYWNNHHHMFRLAESIDGAVLWANLHLLFWLSLYPFTTSWMDETDVAPVPVLVYGVNLLLAAIAYVILQQTIIRLEGPDSRLKTAIGSDWKGKVSPLIYLLGIAVTFISPWLSVALYAVVALIWLVPDKRLEAFVAQIEEREAS